MIESRPGTDSRKGRFLEPEKPRFSVRVDKQMASAHCNLVYDERLQIVVFHWYGATGEQKSEAVAAALNSLEPSGD